MKAEYITHMGDDLMVVNAAMVSMNKWKEAFTDADAKLIRYLAGHNHFTPFCHPQAQIRITAPLFVARQWFRSTVGVARNERSRRYVDDDLAFFIPDEWRSRPEESIKQGSGGPLSGLHQRDANIAANTALEACTDAFTELLELGVAPEQARMFLPQSMETQWIETGSLAYFARICKQRMDGHAQQETQDLAFQIHQIIQPLFPISWDALMIGEANE